MCFKLKKLKLYNTTNILLAALKLIKDMRYYSAS